MAPKSRSSTSSTLIGRSSSFPSSKASSSSTSAASKKASSSISQPKASTSSTASTKAKSAATGKPTATGDLDPYDKAWAGIYKASKGEMGKPVHGDDFTPLDVILRVFDCQEEWGPASNISRLERWERADKMGLEPPREIGAILKTQSARSEERYRKSVFNL